MNKIAMILIALLSFPVSARTQMYVEVGEGIIALTARCNADLVHECNCAIAGPGVVPSIDDAFMCWAIEGDKIIFTSDKYRFEKRLDEIKVRIDPDADDKPEEPVPWSENS